jgi:hypothetical protein
MRDIPPPNETWTINTGKNPLSFHELLFIREGNRGGSYRVTAVDSTTPSAEKVACNIGFVHVELKRALR